MKATILLLRRQARWILASLLIVTAKPVIAQSGYSYVTNDGAITITSYNCSKTVATVPSMINGWPVRTIGPFAFSPCNTLTNVTIEPGVTHIDTRAFYHCVNLTNVTLPESITTIGSAAFGACRSLKTITVDTQNPVYSSVEGILFTKGQRTLLAYPGGKTGSYSIPGTVTYIGDWAFFSSTNVTAVTIPDSVTTIGGYAFRECSNLRAVAIGSKTGSIGVEAFSSCRRLTNVSIGNSVASIGDLAFINCTDLSTIMIPDSVTSIGSGALHSCSRLTNISIGRSVTTIGNWAFAYCGGLTSVVMPESLRSCGSNVFLSCSALKGVFFQGDAPAIGDNSLSGTDAFVYYLPGTTGWGASFAGRLTTPWRLPEPVIVDFGASFGMRTNRFGFVVSWARSAAVVVETCTNLSTPVWCALVTNNLVNGWTYFSDADWVNYPTRFYRIRFP